MIGPSLSDPLGVREISLKLNDRLGLLMKLRRLCAFVCVGRGGCE